MFVDLLGSIDRLKASELPTTKSEWMIFIDAGVAVLELYSTLSNGFVKGGAKVAQAHSSSITKGIFDPTKLWRTESSNEKDSFRE